jgi:SAM-dependent methyltransferase
MNSAERHYVGEQSQEYHGKKRAVPPDAIPWVAHLRAEKLQPFIRPTDTVFEFGAGYGWNLLELRCARKVAFDIADLPRPADPLIEWVQTAEALADEFGDVIICHHALEHVMNPPQTLATMRRILKTNGKLLLFVPFEKERRYRQFDPAEPNHHLYSWNAQTLGNLVSECGFQIESAGIGQFGYDRFAAKLAVKLRAGESGFRFLRAITHLLKPAAEVRVVAVKR